MSMEAKLKHLEFIQSVISRMATNSFLFKGCAITIAAGISAFAAVETKPAVLSIALISTAMFWGVLRNGEEISERTARHRNTTRAALIEAGVQVVKRPGKRKFVHFEGDRRERRALQKAVRHPFCVTVPRISWPQD
jgi:hypothetical protein